MLNVLESGKMKEIEKMVIKARLEQKSYNITHTSKDLGIGIRTLQRKMKRYGLDKEPGYLARLAKSSHLETTEETGSADAAQA